MDVTLGIDVGTSGIRVAAVGRDGEAAALASAPLAGFSSASGRHQQDPRDWWAALEQVFAKIELGSVRPVALAIDGTSGTVLAVDGQGEPLSLASMYNDVASNGSVAAVDAAAPPDLQARGKTSPLARALELRGNAHRIVHQADWLLGKFCGRYDLSDENNALKTGYDPVARQWPNWIYETGLSPSLLPRVLPAGTAISQISAAMADHFHLPKDLAIVAGTTDGCAAFLASGAKNVGDGVTSLGTSLTLKLLSARPIFAPQYGIYSHRVGDQWLAGGASNSGGAALLQFFTPQQMEEMMMRLKPDVPTGLNYYPLPAVGERFPVNDAEYAPRVTPRPGDDCVFFQGLLEGVADVEALGYQRLQEFGATPLKSIRSLGGGASNKAWTSIRLGKLGVPASPTLSEHAAVGTALLAWRGVS